ncbi:MAG: hypothetical protein ACRD9L_02205 [Bryobacteraceae bacterium]
MSRLALPSNFPSWRPETTPETLPTGIHEVDALLTGFPRGRITEITGPASSGRTSLLASILSAATRRGETCALIDAHDAFDPTSGAASGIDLNKLIWVRCGGNAGHAMKATDLLIHAGGFGAVALDFTDVPARITNHIPASWWFRFRHAVENTPTVFAILSATPQARSCAAMQVEMKRESARFAGKFPFQLLCGADYRIVPRKPVRPAPARFHVKALG